MLKSLYWGILSLLFVCAICLMTSDWSYIYKLSGIIGIICFITFGVTVSTFNTATGTRRLPKGEWEKNQGKRIHRATTFLLFGLPHLIAAAIYVFVFFLR